MATGIPVFPVGYLGIVKGADLNKFGSLISLVSPTGSPVSVATLTTVGNGTITASSLVSGMIVRSGPTGAFTDTTATATAIWNALTNRLVGQSFRVVIRNTVAFPGTLAGGTGVTIGGVGVVPALGWLEVLVKIVSRTAVTVTGIASGLNVAVPASKYTTGALQSATFAAGGLTGAEFVCYDNTGTTPGNLQTRTAAEMFGDVPNATVGQSWMLAIRNSSGSANTATITAGSNVTLTGTMTIAQNVTRLFNCKFTSATAMTIQSMGILAAGA